METITVVQQHPTMTEYAFNHSQTVQQFSNDKTPNLTNTSSDEIKLVKGSESHNSQSLFGNTNSSVESENNDKMFNYLCYSV